MRRFLAVFVLVLLAGCSQPTVDTSSDEKMKESIAEVKESLPENRRAEFDRALLTLSMSQVDFAEVLATGKTPDKETVGNDLKKSLEGKTAEEIIAAADNIVATQKAKERERALREIQELNKERDAATAAAAELAKFEVLRSRFYKERDYFGSLEPRILLRVRNGTKHPISRAYFKGKITSPGRSVPWLEEEFNYPISGGLEPGEEAEWVLAPNQFSEWGRVNAPSDAGLIVIVTRLDGPNGEAVLSTQEFTEEDQARLAALQKEYR
ncbi:MAG TPA: DUF6694 family lipoprotein [Thermoanaerobaculia bacterium]|jgi:hypothetical protein|nr:DUF6694 family lipoprotein [Thermoanaerobaculia bacterium]